MVRGTYKLFSKELISKIFPRHYFSDLKRIKVIFFLKKPCRNNKLTWADTIILTNLKEKKENLKINAGRSSKKTFYCDNIKPLAP
jgi:hypothetical protein